MVTVTVSPMVPEDPDYEVILVLSGEEARALRTWLGKSSPAGRLTAVPQQYWREPGDRVSSLRASPLLHPDRGLFRALYEALGDAGVVFNPSDRI